MGLDATEGLDTTSKFNFSPDIKFLVGIYFWYILNKN